MSVLIDWLKCFITVTCVHNNNINGLYLTSDHSILQASCEISSVLGKREEGENGSLIMPFCLIRQIKHLIETISFKKKYTIIKSALQHIANQEATGAIIRPKARWIEEGEKTQNMSYH